MGADKSVMGLSDDRALGHSHYALAFAQDHFHDLGIFVLYFRNLHGERRRGHRVEIHQLPFSLGDDLLGDDQDVAADEAEILGQRCLNDDLGEIHPWCDVWQPLQSDDPYFGSHAKPSLLPQRGLCFPSRRDSRALESLYAAQ